MRRTGIILAGAAVAVLGAIFHFQGQGFVGPESSFMYRSEDWTGYGLYIAAAGIAAVLAGIFAPMLQRR